MTEKRYLKNYGEKMTEEKINKFIEDEMDDAPATIEKMCIRCLKYPLKDGEDYCLGHMEGVKSACCGHGVEKGFIILNDGRRFEEVENHENG